MSEFRAMLIKRAKARQVRIAFAEGDDPRVQEAAARLRSSGAVEPILVGGPETNPAAHPRLKEVAELLRARNPERVRDGIDALDQASDPLRFALGLVALGGAEGCVAGVDYATSDILQATLWAIGIRAGVELASAAHYLVFADDRVLTFTDCAVVVSPDATTLAQIALAAAVDRPRVVGDTPRVAFLTPRAETPEAEALAPEVRRAMELFHDLAPGILAAGPVEADVALVPEIANRRTPLSSLGGRANILVFPSLEVGSIACQLVQRLAGAQALGPVLQGLAKPVSALSRDASVDDIVDVAAMVALLSGSAST